MTTGSVDISVNSSGDLSVDGVPCESSADPGATRVQRTVRSPIRDPSFARMAPILDVDIRYRDEGV